MTDAYSGGPTTFIKVMNKEEAEAHVLELCEYEDAHPQPDSAEFKENIRNIFNQCYNS
jgi:hypothetical protein